MSPDCTVPCKWMFLKSGKICKVSMLPLQCSRAIAKPEIFFIFFHPRKYLLHSYELASSVIRRVGFHRQWPSAEIRACKTVSGWLHYNYAPTPSVQSISDACWATEIYDLLFQAFSTPIGSSTSLILIDNAVWSMNNLRVPMAAFRSNFETRSNCSKSLLRM